MKTYVVKFIHGVHNDKVLVIAVDENDAKRQFLLAFPRLREYNIFEVVETKKKVFGPLR